MAESIMDDQPKKLNFIVVSRRRDAHGSGAHCKNAEVVSDINWAGNPEAFSPAELLLAACLPASSRASSALRPILKFSLHGVEVRVYGVRQDVPPKM